MLLRGKQDRSDVGPVRLIPPVNRSSRSGLIGSAVLVAVSCLIGLVWWVWYDGTVFTVVAAEQIDKGETIELSDLKRVRTSGDFERISSLDEVVGRVAANSIEPGEAIISSDFGESLQVAPGMTVTGVLLKPGGYPTSKVQIGSRVDVIVTSTASSDARLVASDVEVFDIEVAESGDEILFALVLSKGDAVEVANAAKQVGGVRISLAEGS